jgi:hypothetical protein
MSKEMVRCCYCIVIVVVIVIVVSVDIVVSVVIVVIAGHTVFIIVECWLHIRNPRPSLEVNESSSHQRKCVEHHC